MRYDATTHAALAVLRQRLAQAAAEMKMNLGERFDHWCQTLDRKLLPRLDSDFPLVAAICGGGSAGKSTLFNALAGRSISPTGGTAGLNRRVLIGVHNRLKDDAPLWDDLRHTFDAAPTPVEDADQLLSPGNPLYMADEAIPSNLVLLDTPDIDTGARGVYANRDLARQSLEVADLFIYIFTNTTYNNRDITDFIARMLTGMGSRPCYLVYRVYPSFSDEEVRAHAKTVMSNIYGPEGGEHVLGIFRADEDNAVAAGEAPLQLRSLSTGHDQLSGALAALDPVRMRSLLLGSMVEDAVDQASHMRAALAAAFTRMQHYARALENVQHQCVQEALSHFPTDGVVRRFAQVWAGSDPGHIKFMRRTGRVVEWPMKSLMRAVRWLKSSDKTPAPQDPQKTPAAELELDLLNAANKLYQRSMDDRLQIDGRSIMAPPVVHEAQDRLRQAPWQTILESILGQKTAVVSWSRELDEELKLLADDMRARMGLLDQIRQTFAALLNVIPATAAVTYILHTGDPVGAAGIKVKLSGLFGLHDLYALIAIPATAGMTSADRNQLEQMLGPLARTWLENKLNVIHNLFESRISGDLLEGLRAVKSRMDDLLPEIDRALAQCKGETV